jgi:glycosyltransferase involved in cell wall biosynthesis
MILNVGNIEIRKNQLGLARALKNLPECKLHLVGGIRDESYFKNILAELPGRVVYHGVFPSNSEELMHLYKKCDVFVLPSYLETPGLAAIEAYAIGAKVVVTSEGSTREYFDNNVIYVDPENTDSIEKGIKDALSEGNVDVGSVEKFRNQFEWMAVIKKMKEIYSEVLSVPN